MNVDELKVRRSSRVAYLRKQLMELREDEQRQMAHLAELRALKCRVIGLLEAETGGRLVGEA